MWSFCKRSSGTLLGQWYKATGSKRDIPKFDTVLLHSNWSKLRRNSNRHKRVELWAKSIKYFGNFERHFSCASSKKSSQHVRAWVGGDGAICSKNRKIVPYHGANPNTRNGARLRSPSPIMAPVLFEDSRVSVIWCNETFFIVILCRQVLDCLQPLYLCTSLCHSRLSPEKIGERRLWHRLFMHVKEKVSEATAKHAGVGFFFLGPHPLPSQFCAGVRFFPDLLHA